jgi:Predicted pyridoxal phosphate-dependent enzyme apparently involved in regulation of cell wall biogenesis
LSKGRLINKATGNTVKAILVVHIFGHPVNIEPVMAIAKKYGLKVIEDAAESLGSFYLTGKYAGKATGTIGHFGCLSFNGNKIITAGGGGMILVPDKKTQIRRDI